MGITGHVTLMMRHAFYALGYYGFGGRSSTATLRDTRTVLDALMTQAITKKMKFEVWDIKDLLESPFKGTRYINLKDESWYSLAVDHENVSACSAFENAIGRPPFFFEGKRLAKDSHFTWDNRSVWVTSFTVPLGAPERSWLVACAYHPNSAKVAKRYKLTPKDLKKGSST